MQRTGTRGLELIKRFEGFQPQIYRDAVGLPTIGYGHLLKPGEAEIFAAGISETAAEALLLSDIRIAEDAVARCIEADLTEAQFDALVSFTFNMGSGALARSQLASKINAGDHKGAPDEFKRWVYAGGRRLRGLVRRRRAEAALYVSA